MKLANRCQGNSAMVATSGGARGSGGVGGGGGGSSAGRGGGRSGLPPIVVNLYSSSSELKLLRVLQTLVNLSGNDVGKSGNNVPEKQ